MERSRYIDDFYSAVGCSYHWLSMRKPKIDERLSISLDQDVTQYFQRLLRDNDIPPLHVSALQCIKWSYFLEDFAKSIFSMNAWITIGQLWEDGTPCFSPTSQTITRWVNKGIHIEDVAQTGINVHAWITMENGIIVDPSILSTLAKINGGSWEKRNGSVLLVEPRYVSPGLTYIPMLVGKKVVAKIQRKSTIPLLAKSLEELYLTGVFVPEPFS